MWSIIFGVATLILLGFCIWSLNSFPDVFTVSETGIFKFNPQSIRAIFIYATIISFGTYFVRLLAKMMMSSFHLDRDAKEREQLTLVYLALSRDNKVPERDMEIILQSIFSRADTGLLGNESAPTMPGIGHAIEAIKTS
jgi:hypothetical protein